MRITTPRDWRTGALLAITAMTVGASAASVDALADRNASSETVTVRASDEFDHNGIWRMLFGDAWRDVWAAEITVPVLDLGSYAGGLKPIKAGGNQSRTLRFQGADGRTYVFRSTEKNVNKVLPDDLKDTPASAVASDQRATFHPTGHGVVTELLHTVGVLHTVPTLVYIPDDPRLGGFREDFANTLGQIEERPDENENGPAFAHAEKIIGGDKLLENLEESLENRVDSREYLTARMIDFMVGDTDRGADQWRFAKFERDETDVYRPIPRDNDYAFMKVEGLAATVGRRVYPRLVCFGEKNSKLRSLLFMTREFDRSHLIELDWPEWEKVVATVQLRLTDYVIERAVAKMPEVHQELSAPLITAGLRARRDALRDIAREYYLLINREADVFGSDEDETAEIDRNADGSVRVRMWRHSDDGGVTAGARVFRAGLSGAPAVRGDELVFERLFVPDETHEIRVYLERGDDRAVVRGVSHRSIDVRVTGGEGDDVLADSSHLERGARTRFYDASGENTFVTGAHTQVDSTPFVTQAPRRSLDEDENQEPEEHPRRVSEERRGRFRDLLPGSEDVIERQMHAGQRFWGSTGGLMVMTGYRESGGVLLGLGPTTTHYGFRQQPYAWRADARGILGTRNGGFAVQAATDRYFENSLWSVALFAHATELESNRFYGYGNDTELLDSHFTLVERFEVNVKPALRYDINATSGVAFGPVMKYVDPDVPEESPAAEVAPLGSQSFGQVGAFADLVLDWTEVDAKEQSGWGLTAGGSAYPAVWDAEDGFGEAHALARVFIPMGWPTLALRAGGQRAWGSFPLHESAFIGGRWTVRGFRWNRFAGDASAYGAAELRVPLFRLTFLTRGQLGVIGFTDTGRVWMDDESDGDWHTGFGGGLWFGTVGRTFSATYAYGDEHRVYFYTSMPF